MLMHPQNRVSQFLGLLLLAVSWAATVTSQPAQVPDENLRLIMEAYDTLNDHLVDLDPKGGPSSNMELAITMLKKPASHLFMALNALKIPKRVPELVLRQFINLKRIEDDPEWRCTRQSYEVLHENDLATSFKARMPDSQFRQPSLRVVKIVRHYAKLHARMCPPVYQARHQRLISSMDESRRAKAERFATGIISELIFNLNPALPEFKLQQELYQRADDRELFVQILDELKGPVDGLWQAQVALESMKDDNSGIERLLEQRLDRVPAKIKEELHEPCHYYVHQLGPELFELAEYDNQMREPRHRFQPFDGSTGAYFWSWAKWLVCRSFLTRDQLKFKKNFIAVLKGSRPLMH